MSSNDRAAGSAPSGNQWFATTHWSMVLAAGQRERPDSQAALARLCEAYWHPLYSYVRRRGHRVEEARDLTQEFFAFLLEKGSLGAADRERGRFRSFLLTTLNHFLAGQWKHAQAQKRGGGRVPISIDSDDAETRYAVEPADDLTPQRLYERRWALTLLGLVLADLRRQFACKGRERQFDRLKGFLDGTGSTGRYREAAAELGMSEGGVKTAVHRLRQQYRELLRQRIADTVASPEDIEDEIRHLFTALESP